MFALSFCMCKTVNLVEKKKYKSLQQTLSHQHQIDIFHSRLKFAFLTNHCGGTSYVILVREIETSEKENQMKLYSRILHNGYMKNKWKTINMTMKVFAEWREFFCFSFNSLQNNVENIQTRIWITNLFHRLIMVGWETEKI